MGQKAWIFSWWFLVLAVVFLIVVWSYFERWRKIWRYKRLPPGPSCWPVVGYLPMLHPSKGYLKLQQLSEKYGGVFSLFVGNRYVVVLNDFAAVKEAFNKEEFLGRPQIISQLNPEQISLLEKDGSEWKDLRHFTSGCFRHLGVGTSEFESFLMTQVSEVTRNLRGQEGRTVNAHHSLELALNNSVFYLTYRKTFEKDHPMIRFLSKFGTAFKINLILVATGAFFPWLSKLLRAVLREVRRTEKEMDQLNMKEVLEHRQTLDPNEPRDYIDYYLLKMDKLGPNPIYNIPSLLANLKLLFTASTDTSRVTLVWFLMLMAANPDVQNKVQKEIDSVLGLERKPRHSDRTQLPYTEAAIHESMRFRNIINYNMFRRTTCDTTLRGFDIPKDTLIVHNMTSQFRSEDLWERPDTFDPGRFLSGDGSKVIVPECFVPLSYGKRNCAGEKLSGIQNFLFSVSLLQRFRIQPADGGAVNLDIKTILTNEQSHPYLRFKWRE